MLLSYLYVWSPTRTHPTPLCEGPLLFLIPPFQTDKGIIERLRGATSLHKCSELNPHHLLREPVWSTSWRHLPISIASMWNTLSIVTVQNDNCVATTCFQRDANCNLWKKKWKKQKMKERQCLQLADVFMSEYDLSLVLTNVVMDTNLRSYIYMNMS